MCIISHIPPPKDNGLIDPLKADIGCYLVYWVRLKARPVRLPPPSPQLSVLLNIHPLLIADILRNHLLITPYGAHVEAACPKYCPM